MIAKHKDNLVEGVKIFLQNKGYLKDNEFYSRFKETKFYGGGSRQIKTKLILESLEESFAHKEAVPFDNLTIEHIMPQTLSEWWQHHLGYDWEETHELYLHTIGNLTNLLIIQNCQITISQNTSNWLNMFDPMSASISVPISLLIVEADRPIKLLVK